MMSLNFGKDLSTKEYISYGINGGQFSVRLQRLSRKGIAAESKLRQPDDVEVTLESKWTREYGTVGFHSVGVTSLSYHSSTNRLLLTGYTSGTSDAFGQGKNEVSGNIDSFLTILDPLYGNVTNVLRLKSSFETGAHRVSNLCFEEEFNTNTTTTITSDVYLVGTIEPEGTNSSYAVLHKIDLNSMSVVWSRRIDGELTSNSKDGQGPNVHGLACAVTKDGEDIYLAGNVVRGTVLYEQNIVENEYGDIFVAKFETLQGDLVYSKQIGSSEKDTLAHGQSLATDSDGNLIVLANTEGSVYRSKIPNGASDLIVFSVGRDDGNYLEPGKFGQPQKKVSSNSKNWVFSMYAIFTVLILSVSAGVLVHYRKKRQKSTQLFDAEVLEIIRSRTNQAMGSKEQEEDRDGIWKSSNVAMPSHGSYRVKESATKFPLGSFSGSGMSGSGIGGGDSVGDVFDLLSAASQRHYNLIKKQEQSRKRFSWGLNA